MGKKKAAPGQPSVNLSREIRDCLNTDPTLSNEQVKEMIQAKVGKAPSDPLLASVRAKLKRATPPEEQPLTIEDLKKAVGFIKEVGGVERAEKLFETAKDVAGLG